MLDRLKRWFSGRRLLRVYQDDLRVVLNYHERLKHRSIPTDEECESRILGPARSCSMMSGRVPATKVNWDVFARPRKLHFTTPLAPCGAGVQQ